MESIPVLDLRLLSQSEISALAISSFPPNYNLHHSFPDDPKIDRSIFNESAGSRKQTYSRLRLAPPNASSLSSPRRRGRPPRSLPNPPLHNKHADADADADADDDNRSILLFLRRLFLRHGLDRALSTPSPHSTPPPPPPPISSARRPGRRKKPRLDPPKDDREMLLDPNSTKVDFSYIAENGDSVFSKEIARRTAGRGSEDELLDFLGALDGKWATARKRRRIVDAAEFAVVLPAGWSLLLALKRKDGKIWLHCRRYLSPSGKQFATCKEVSDYLLSIVGPECAVSFPKSTQSEDPAMSPNLTGAHASGPMEQDNFKLEASMPPSDVANTSEIHSAKIIKCRKCNIEFPEKNSYDQHYLTFHLSARRSTLGKTVASGVIINDGKFQCQYCHKIFTEWRSYSGHVGVHVRFRLEAPEASQCKMMMQTEPRPSPLDMVSLSPSDKQVEPLQSETAETLPRVEISEILPESSSLDPLPLSSSEPKDGVVEGKFTNQNPFEFCESGASIQEVNNLKTNEDSDNLKCRLSNITLQPSGSEHTYIPASNSGKIFEDKTNLRNCDGNNVDPENFANINSGFETKNNSLVDVHGEADCAILDSNGKSIGEFFDGGIKESTMQIENSTNEIGVVSVSIAQSDINAEVDCRQHDEKSLEAEITTNRHCDKSMHAWVTHYNSEESFQGCGLGIVPSANEHNNLTKYSCHVEASRDVLENSVDKSVKDLTNNMVGEILGKSSEIDDIHVFEVPYNENYMVPCTDTSEASADISGVEKAPCFSETNIDFNNTIDSCNDQCGVPSVDCNMIHSSEIGVNISGDDRNSIQNSVKEDLGIIAKSTNKLSTRVHAPANNQNFSSDLVKPSPVTYNAKDLSIDTMVEEDKTYQKSFKFNSESNLSSLPIIWQQSNEREFFANRATDDLESSICDQQFYLEDNLHSLAVDESPYNIQTASSDIFGGVVEEHGVTTETSLLMGQDLSNGNNAGNDFICSNSRSEEGAKGSLYIPPSTSQSFGMTSHTTNFFPFDVEDSLMCQARNLSVFEGSLGDSFGGSDKVRAVDNPGIAGTDLIGSPSAPSSLIQSQNYFSPASVIPGQEKADKCYYSDQQRECLAGSRGAQADGYESPASRLLADQDSQMRSDQHLNFDYDGSIEDVFEQPTQFNWDMTLPHMNDRQKITVTCIWCGDNFTQGSNIHVQPDSVGFICPNCKAKISGQLKF